MRVAEALRESAATGRTVEAAMKITVVGLGKIGLPLAVQFAGRGHRVVGADIDRQVVAAVREARPPFPGEAHLDERLAEVVGAGALEATTDTTAAVAASDAVVVVVPLYVDAFGAPEFSAIDAATGGGRARPAPRHPRHVRDHAAGRHHPRRASRRCSRDVSGLRAGEDFFLAFSPERVSSGRVFADLARYPKLVGGLDEESARRAVEFYGVRAALRRAPGPRASRTACGTSARRRPRSWPSWRRPPTAT